MFNGFQDLFDQFLNQAISIPLINPLSYLYVIFNLIAWVFALFLSGSEAA